MSERYKRYSFSWWWGLGVVLALLAPTSSLAQPSTGSVLSPSLTVGRSTCGAMPDPAARVYGLWIATDAATTSACGAGGGSNYVLYMDTGTSWVARVAGNSDVACADVTDSTAAGCALLTALTAALQRTALGLGTSATLNVPASGDAAAGEVAKGNDSRFTDARTPTAHNQASTTISDSTAAGRSLLTAADAAAQRLALSLGTAALVDVPASGNASTSQAVKGNDTRLSDARTPTSTLAHASTHAAAGSDPVTLTPAQVVGATTGKCARFDASGILVAASGDCASGDTDTTGTDDQTAAEVSYSNTTSGLTATDVQAAIDEVAAAGGGASSSGTTVQTGDGAGGFTATKLAVGADGASVTTTTTPSDFSGLVTWLKADALSLSDGDPVGTWTDSSGNGKTFSNTSTARPTFKTAIRNSLPVVRFDGSTDCLISDSTLALSTFSLFVVFNTTSATPGMIYEQSATAASNDGSYMYGATGSSVNVKRSPGSSGRSLAQSTGNWSIGQWLVARQTFDGTYSGHAIYLNGALRTQPNDAASDPGTSTVTDTVYLGCRNNAALYSSIDIAEFIVFSPRLSGAQERAVELYLMNKYNF